MWIGLRHGGTWKTKMRWKPTLQGKNIHHLEGEIFRWTSRGPSILETGRRGPTFIRMSCEITGVMIKIHWVGSLNQHGPCCNVLKRPLAKLVCWVCHGLYIWRICLTQVLVAEFFIFPKFLSLGERWMHVRIMQDFCALPAEVTRIFVMVILAGTPLNGSPHQALFIANQ